MLNPPITGIPELDSYLYQLQLGGNEAAGVTPPSGGNGVGFPNQYLHVKYATSNTGAGFSNSPTNATYFGIFSSAAATESTNATDYTWALTTGFGVSNYLYYLLLGGRQIKFAVAATAPSYKWVVDSGSAIDLDVLITDNVINTDDLVDDSVVADKIGPGAITTDKIIAAAITELKIAANAVTATKINVAALDQALGDLRADTVSAAQIATDAVTSIKIAAAAVTANKTDIAALDAVSGNLNTNTVSAAQLVTDAVTSIKIAAAAVTANKTTIAAIDPTSGNLSLNSVTAGKIAAGTIVANDIAAETITGAKIAAETIVAGNIATGAITAGKIAAGAIVANDIAAETITGAKIAAETIGAGQIAANAITAVKIEAGAVTAVKILAGTITADKMVAGTITALSGIIANAAIGNAQIGGTIQSDAFVSGSAGWAIGKDGTAQFNIGTFRGAVNVGAFTGYAWPAAGNYGAHLSASGLLLGNANNGKYFQVEAAGNIYAPGFSVVNGVLTISQLNVIGTGNIVNNSVTVSNSASGTNTASTNITIPSGVTARLFAIGSKGASSEYGSTLLDGVAGYLNITINGNTKQYLSRGTSRSWDTGPETTNYASGFGSVTGAHEISVTGPATVTATAAFDQTIYVTHPITLVLFARFK